MVVLPKALLLRSAGEPGWEMYDVSSVRSSQYLSWCSTHEVSSQEYFLTVNGEKKKKEFSFFIAKESYKIFFMKIFVLLLII